MTAAYPAPPGGAGGGLCESCRNARVVMARNGARFFLCRLSATSPHFAKYPRTPVVLCAGHAPQSMTTAQVPGPGPQRR